MKYAVKKFVLSFLFNVIGQIMPLAMVRPVSVVVGNILNILGFRKKVILQNIEIAFNGAYPEDIKNKTYKEIAKKYYIHLSIVFFEVLLLKHLNVSKLDKIFIIENTEIFNRKNRGVIALSAHVGNWELLACMCSRNLNEQVNLVVKTQQDFGFMNQVRSRFGSKIIDVGVSARTAVNVLHRGEIIAFLADQSPTQNDEVLTMFNHPTHAFTATARLALKLKPIVVLCFLNRKPNGTYVCKMQEFNYDDLSYNQAGINEFTQRYLNALQANIYQYPEQWLWSHKRWKHIVKY